VKQHNKIKLLPGVKQHNKIKLLPGVKQHSKIKLLPGVKQHNKIKLLPDKLKNLKKGQRKITETPGNILVILLPRRGRGVKFIPFK
jgi:hypothetical protein